MSCYNLLMSSFFRIQCAKKWLKLVHFWRSYYKNKNVSVFWDTVYICYVVAWTEGRRNLLLVMSLSLCRHCWSCSCRKLFDSVIPGWVDDGCWDWEGHYRRTMLPYRRLSVHVARQRCSSLVCWQLEFSMWLRFYTPFHDVGVKHSFSLISPYWIV